MKYTGLALAAIASTASAASFSVCSGKTDGLGVSSVTFSPDPPTVGSLTIKVAATPTVEVTDGATMSFAIKYGALTIKTVEKDFCNDLGVSCPVAAGSSVNAEVEIDVTTGGVTVTAEGTTTNGDGSFVSCLDIPISVSSALSLTELPLTISHEIELTTEVVDHFFGLFKTQFNRVYEDDEEHEARKANFHASLKRVQDKNKELEEPNFGVTKFSDMSEDEFRRKMLTYRPEVTPDHPTRLNAVSHQAALKKLRGGKKFSETATDFDWRDEGAVTDVKDQGQCGSCWAFSTTETIESAHMRAGNDLTELSVEQIVQCDTKDAGCNGGDTITAYDYIQTSKGLATESDYPYTSGRGVTGSCDSSKEGSVLAGTNVDSWKYATPACTSVKCNSQDEDTLASSLNSVAPVSICVDAEPWQDYTTGVLKASSCKSGYYALDHCVQLIGYSGISGSDGYWIVRNSWASDWGVDGMIHLEYGENTCGVADEATLVTLK
ncbi:hypothetical protein TrST_g1538 [Triparma strigata]|uniref:Uncharacterized protein n=1 Tax=Triparma strigata TaxID=1606541 RepID=A0A9W7BVQ1_9STRA|nr:hypothetical protein TrST_g1538 [Triparma strigata]